MSVQLVIYQVGLIPSQFFGVLSEKNYGKFKELVAFSVLLVLLNSAVRSPADRVVLMRSFKYRMTFVVV